MKYFRNFMGAFAVMIVFSIGVVFDLFMSAFVYAAEFVDRHLIGSSDTEHADRMSQTGNGVWAFVTNLFKVEGRTYTWQAGAIG